MGHALAARDDRELFSALQGLPIRTGMPAAPQPEQAGQGRATASMVLGIIGLVTLLISFGFLSVLSLPLSATAWGLGRSARRSAQGGESWRSTAKAGEITGVIGTSLSFLLVAGCATVIALGSAG